MTITEIESIANGAVSGLRSRTGNFVDSVFAHMLIDNFLNAFRKINKSAYHGDVYTRDVRRVLELYFCYGGDKVYLISVQSAYDFFQQHGQPYNTATYADYARFLTQKRTADAFGI